MDLDFAGLDACLGFGDLGFHLVSDQIFIMLVQRPADAILAKTENIDSRFQIAGLSALKTL